MHNITSIPGSNLTKSLSHRYRIRIRLPRNIKPLKTSNILEDVLFLIENTLVTSATQDIDNSNKNLFLHKILIPNNRTKGRFGSGPMNHPGTIAIRSRFRLKCPKGSIRNKLGQCVYRSTLIAK